MRLQAISDLHVAHRENRDAFARLEDHGDDWLILAGDLCETEKDLGFVLRIATSRFARVIWVPGNHELWTVSPAGRRGEAKYLAMVDICRLHGVLTPEDPYAIWPGPGGAHVIAPMFLLYDYSFRPESLPLCDAVDWARATQVECVDEHCLHPDPFPSRQAWCEARCRLTAARLAEAALIAPLIMVNHFPTRRDLAVVPRYPRFSLWCGTTATDDWHLRFRAKVVVTGHLHIPSTRWIDGVRFEEVSFGYPNQHARRRRGIQACLREILPGPAPPSQARSEAVRDPSPGEQSA